MQYNTIQYSTIQYIIIRYNTIHHNSVFEEGGQTYIHAATVAQDLCPSPASGRSESQGADPADKGLQQGKGGSSRLRNLLLSYPALPTVTAFAITLLLKAHCVYKSTCVCKYGLSTTEWEYAGVRFDSSSSRVVISSGPGSGSGFPQIDHSAKVSYSKDAAIGCLLLGIVSRLVMTLLHPLVCYTTSLTPKMHTLRRPFSFGGSETTV